MRNEILDEFLEFIKDEEHSVLLSSHITSDLDRVADYITYLHKGNVFLAGEKDTLLEELDLLTGASLLAVAAGAVVLIAAAVVISYRVSCRIFDKKEF